MPFKKARRSIHQSIATYPEEAGGGDKGQRGLGDKGPGDFEKD